MLANTQRRCAVRCLAVLCFAALAASGQSALPPNSAQQLEDRLRSHPQDAATIRALHMLLASANHLSREESMRLRGVLRTHPEKSPVTLTPPAEPGDLLIIAGTIRDAQGQPVAGALLTVFHTDAKGLYSLRDAETHHMDEPNSRLFAFIQTGPDGRYEFRTVRPGGYPYPLPNHTGDQAWIPQHIHLIASADGYLTFGCGRETCQLVFADDLRMTPHWQEWARELHNPVLTLQPAAGGFRKGTFDISLRKRD